MNLIAKFIKLEKTYMTYVTYVFQVSVLKFWNADDSDFTDLT